MSMLPKVFEHCETVKKLIDNELATFVLAQNQQIFDWYLDERIKSTAKIPFLQLYNQPTTKSALLLLLLHKFALFLFKKITEKLPKMECVANQNGSTLKLNFARSNKINFDNFVGILQDYAKTIANLSDKCKFCAELLSHAIPAKRADKTMKALDTITFDNVELANVPSFSLVHCTDNHMEEEIKSTQVFNSFLLAVRPLSIQCKTHCSTKNSLTKIEKFIFRSQSSHKI